MDFKASFTASITAAQDLSARRASIRTVLEKFASDLQEASNNKVVIFFKENEYFPSVDLSSVLGDVVYSDGGRVRLMICVRPFSKVNVTDRFAYIEFSAVDGYPCFLDFSDSRYVANDTEELGNSLKVMLEAPLISQKLYNSMMSDAV